MSYSLIHAMEISNNIDDMLSMVNMIFLKAIDKNNKQNSVIDSALNRIKDTNGVLTIKELSENEYISERHLNRLFNQFAYDKEQGDDGKRIEQCRKWVCECQ